MDLSGYFVHHPAPPLSRFVDHSWQVVDHPAALREKLLPDGGVELIFNRGEAQRLYEDERSDRFSLYRRSWISGQRLQPIVIGSPGLANLIGVRFKLAGASAVLGVPLCELSDQVVEMDAVWGAAAEDLRGKLIADRAPTSRFATLEAALTSMLIRRPKRQRLVEEAVSRLESPGAEQSISGIPADLGVSTRHLSRTFREMVGLSPKSLSRVLRFQRAIAALDGLGDVDWPRLALELGYYDQAHFVHEFSAFSGLSPGRYLRQRGDVPNYLPLE